MTELLEYINNLIKEDEESYSEEYMPTEEQTAAHLAYKEALETVKRHIEYQIALKQVKGEK